MSLQGKHPTETLEYIRSMLSQLGTKARSERRDMLVYLIEMAYLEVDDVLEGERRLGSRQHKRDSAA